MKKMILLSAFTIAAASAAFAQDGKAKSQHIKTPDEFRHAYLGIGFGLEHGGLGLKMEYLPIKYIGLFGGVGYNFVGVGLNAGATFKALPDCKITPVAIGMYGYNSVILVRGASQYNKIYYGPTVGIGGELKVGRRKNKLYASVLYPFRSKEFDRDYDNIRTNTSITIEKSPVAFSFGFNFAL